MRDVRGPLYLLWGAAIGRARRSASAISPTSRWRVPARASTSWAHGSPSAPADSTSSVSCSSKGCSSRLRRCRWRTRARRWMLSALRLASCWRRSPLQIDATVAASRSGSRLLAGLLIGLVSASPLYTMRLGAMLHESTRSGTRGRAVRATRRTLVVAQMACSFMLLVGLGAALGQHSQSAGGRPRLHDGERASPAPSACPPALRRR